MGTLGPRHGAVKETPGTIGAPVRVGGAMIRHGDVRARRRRCRGVEQERLDAVLHASLSRANAERDKRIKLEEGELSFDLDGLRAKLEAER